MFSLTSNQWQIAFTAMFANALPQVNFHSIGDRQSPTAFLYNRHHNGPKRLFVHKAVFIETAI